MAFPGGITTITVTGTYASITDSPASGEVLFTPSSVLTDSGAQIILTGLPAAASLNDAGEFSIVLPCTDCPAIRPSPFYYTVTQAIGGAYQQPFNISLPATLGSSVDISALAPVPSMPAPEPGLYVISVNGQSGSVTIEGGGGGSVDSVTAGDASVTVSGTAENPVLETGRLDQIASLHPATAAVSFGGQKATALASGSASTDAVTYGQLGSAAFQAASAFDASGAAGTAQGAAEAFATSAVATETSRAEAAEVLLAPLASPALTGSPTAPTATALTGSTRVATTAYADSAVAVETSRAESAESANAAGISAETSRAEAAEALKAPLASPALTGSPTAPTQTTGDNSTKIATDQFVTTAVAAETTRAEAAEALLATSSALTAETSRAEAAEALLAPLASPAFTGTPTAPTKTALTSNTDVATTAYADSAVAAETSRAETAEALKAPLASPALTGTPTAPTAVALTSNMQVATTAYADSAVGAEKTRALAAEALLAPLASPALTGSPTAPTQSGGDSSTKIATDAFVANAVAGYLPLPSGTAVGGNVPVATGSGNASAWGTASAGGLSAGKVYSFAHNYAMP